MIIFIQLLGTTSTPKLLSGRCVFIFLLLTAYCIVSYYTSVLVSTLVKAGTKNTINSIENLENSPIKVGFEDIPYIHSFLNVRIRSYNFYIDIQLILFFLNLFNRQRMIPYIDHLLQKKST